MNQTNVILVAVVCAGMVAAAPMMVHEAEAAFTAMATCNEAGTAATFSWSGEPTGTTHYTINAFTHTGGFNVIASESSYVGSSISLTVVPGTPYRANVIAEPSSTSVVVDFTCQAPPPPPPFEVSATCGPNQTATLSWTGQPSNAVSYNVRLYPQATGNTPSTSDTSITVNVTPGVEHTARVAAYDDMNRDLGSVLSAPFQCKNNPPGVSAGYDFEWFTGVPRVFDGSVSNPDRDTVTISWECSPSVEIAHPGRANGRITIPIGTPDGTRITCTITASDGHHTVSDSVVITSNNSPTDEPADTTPTTPPTTPPPPVFAVDVTCNSGTSATVHWDGRPDAASYEGSISKVSSGEVVYRIDSTAKSSITTGDVLDHQDFYEASVTSYAAGRTDAVSDDTVFSCNTPPIVRAWSERDSWIVNWYAYLNAAVTDPDFDDTTGSWACTTESGESLQVDGYVYAKVWVPGLPNGHTITCTFTAYDGFDYASADMSFTVISSWDPASELADGQAQDAADAGAARGPEPLPTRNGIISNIRMASVPHLDMWNGTTAPFQCGVTGGGSIRLNPTYDGMSLIRGMFSATDSATGDTWEAPLDTAIPTNATATYNVTVHTTATYNHTQIRPYAVLLDIHAGGLDWRIYTEALATFQNAFGTVDVLARHQYGSVLWSGMGASCMPN